MIEKLIRKVCERIALGRVARHIPGKSARDLYLSRFYLYPPHTAGESDQNSDDAWGISLHHFHRSDEDLELHSHPWGWSFSIILTGGYEEERRVGWGGMYGYTVTGVVKATFRPGRFNIIRANDFHRVLLLDPQHGAWTLFAHGPRIQDWGFWDPLTGIYEAWQPFIARRAAEARAIEAAAHKVINENF
jgi:hypothetical protein